MECGGTPTGKGYRSEAGRIGICSRPGDSWAFKLSVMMWLREGTSGHGSLNLTSVDEDLWGKVMDKFRGGDWHCNGVTYLALPPERGVVLLKELRLGLGLKTLWLGRSHLVAEEWNLILSMVPTLESLSIDECKLEANSGVSLCHALRKTKSLRALNIRGCFFSEEDMDLIVFTLTYENASVKHFIDISQNEGYYWNKTGKEIVNLNRKAQVLCERAVFALLPFTCVGAWFPRDILRMIGTNFGGHGFSFYYISIF